MKSLHFFRLCKKNSVKIAHDPLKNYLKNAKQGILETKLTMLRDWYPR